jgi:hypothetical protein
VDCELIAEEEKRDLDTSKSRYAKMLPVQGKNENKFL